MQLHFRAEAASLDETIVEVNLLGEHAAAVEFDRVPFVSGFPNQVLLDFDCPDEQGERYGENNDSQGDIYTEDGKRDRNQHERRNQHDVMSGPVFRFRIVQQFVNPDSALAGRN